MITNGKGEFDQDVLVFSNHFKIKYDQSLEAYNGGQFVMLLIKNVTTTSKGIWYIKAQHYTILTKVVYKTTWTHIFKLHSKLSGAQLALKEVSLSPILCTIQCFFQIYTKNIKQNQMVIPWSTIL